MSLVLKHLVSFLFALFVAEFFWLSGGQGLVYDFLDFDPKIRHELNYQSLMNNLETGKVVVFGSSELSLTSKNTLQFMVSNFFSRNGQPVETVGKGGHQLMAILSELVALHSQKSIDNAKIVVMLSPTWFTGKYADGTKMSIYLKFMTNDMMYKLYTNNMVDDQFKFFIRDYITANEKRMSGSSRSYDLMKQFGRESSYPDFSDGVLSYLSDTFSILSRVDFYNDQIGYESGAVVKYDFPPVDYDSLYRQAMENNSQASTNNVYGIRNSYFKKHILKNDKGDIRISSVGKIRPVAKNREYQTLLQLLQLLKEYKIKPLFVMQDLHPFIYTKDRKNILPVLALVKASVTSAGFEYLDMWSYTKADYINGELKDKMHLGELGWMKVNRKIVEHFNLN